MHLHDHFSLRNQDLTLTRTELLNTKEELKGNMQDAIVDLEMMKATQSYNLTTLWKKVFSQRTYKNSSKGYFSLQVSNLNVKKE